MVKARLRVGVGEGGGLRRTSPYLLSDKIIMLLPGKYGIICASKQRSSNDAC